MVPEGTHRVLFCSWSMVLTMWEHMSMRLAPAWTTSGSKRVIMKVTSSMIFFKTPTGQQVFVVDLNFLTQLECVLGILLRDSRLVDGVGAGREGRRRWHLDLLDLLDSLELEQKDDGIDLKNEIGIHFEPKDRVILINGLPDWHEAAPQSPSECSKCNAGSRQRWMTSEHTRLTHLISYPFTNVSDRLNCGTFIVRASSSKVDDMVLYHFPFQVFLAPICPFGLALGKLVRMIRDQFVLDSICQWPNNQDRSGHQI